MQVATFTNRATLSYNGTTVNSNTVTGNIIEVLSATKTATRETYSIGDSVTYIVSITNSGTTPLTGVTVYDDLGAYQLSGTTLVPLEYVDGSIVYYQNGVLQPTPTISATNPLTVTGITVPAGGNAILVYEALTTEFAPPSVGGEIINTVTVTQASITTPVTAIETVAVSEAPLLSIAKCLSPVNVTENGQLTYTFTIQNSGNTEAQATDNVVVSDTFNPILTGITVTLDGVTLPPASYTYSEATGEFATVAGAISVPAATFTQDPVTGVYTVTPGVSVLTVTGTV